MTRNHYFDNMKAFLIFFVVLGHVLERFWGDGTQYQGTIYLWIYTFHMPAFVFILGYFASTKVKNTIARFLPLYLLFQIGQMTVYGIYNYIDHPETASFSLDLLQPAWTLWYLLAIMFYALLTPLFDTTNRKRQVITLVIAVAAGLLISFVPDLNNFLAINRTVTFLPYFLLGYYGKKNQVILPHFYDAKKTKREYRMLYRILGLLAGVVLTVIIVWNAGDMYYRWFYGTMDYYGDFSVATKIGTYVLGLVWLVIILCIIPTRRLPLIDRIGQNTLSIYLLHIPIICLLFVIDPVKAVLDRHILLVFVLAVAMVWWLGAPKVTAFFNKLKLPLPEKLFKK